MLFGRRWAATLILAGWIGGSGVAVASVCSRLLAPLEGPKSQSNEIDDYFGALHQRGVRTVFLLAIGGGNDVYL